MMSSNYSTLKTDDDGAYLLVIEGIMVTDADSPADSFDVTITSGDKRVTGKLAAVDGTVNTVPPAFSSIDGPVAVPRPPLRNAGPAAPYQCPLGSLASYLIYADTCNYNDVTGKDNQFSLTLTITGDDKLDDTEITLKIVDNHSFEATRSFNLKVTTFRCQDRLKHVRWDHDGGIRGSYGVKKVEVLDHGHYRVHWIVPFQDTKYAVTGINSANTDTTTGGGDLVTINVVPHDGYTEDLRGDAARNQFLHTDYVDVSTQDRGGNFVRSNHNHLMAMTASKDDGCDNTNVYLATYTSPDANTAPVSTPDVRIYMYIYIRMSTAYSPHSIF